MIPYLVYLIESTVEEEEEEEEEEREKEAFFPELLLHNFFRRL